MVCSRRFWTAPSAERWVETFWIAAEMVSIAAVALVSSSPDTWIPFTPSPRALIIAISTSILLSSVESAPTWRLKFKEAFKSANASTVTLPSLSTLIDLISPAPASLRSFLICAINSSCVANAPSVASALAFASAKASFSDKVLPPAVSASLIPVTNPYFLPITSTVETLYSPLSVTVFLVAVPKAYSFLPVFSSISVIFPLAVL